MLEPDLVLLSRTDSKADSSRQMLYFSDGTHVHLDCDDDEGILIADVVAERNKHGGSVSKSDELSAEELRAIEARVNATTPGPWRSIIEGRDQDSGSSFIMTEGEDIYLRGSIGLARFRTILPSVTPAKSPALPRSRQVSMGLRVET